MSVKSYHSDLTNELIHYVELAKNGDKDAFQTLVSKVANTVSAIALNITKNIQDSHDVSQLVFIKVWQQIKQLKNNDSVLPWIRQITRYTAINFVRDNRINREILQDEDALDILLDKVCDEQHQIDTQLIKQQQSELICHLLDQLPDESREIVLLYYREEHNSKAVANLLGLTESTVRKRLQRVRLQLKSDVLAKYGEVIFATAPIGLVSLFAITATTSAPIAASTFTMAIATKQSHWFSKFLLSLGGAALGGIIAIVTNTLMMNYMKKHIDNQEDVRKLNQLKHKSNVVIALTCLCFVLSYHFTNGWLMPVVTYSIFLVGLYINIQAANKITHTNLCNQAQYNSKSAKLLQLSKWGNKLGWLLGLGGGTLGLIYGLYTSGRFQYVF
ncbi:sigma-70 family RNA polymerase sigma factor [Thalassotalea sp. 1_MG-2023]|uniref:RNA polymerase sigma factor n=1 Tax=Thalassotalea sp. 1_MG-2023 TaxID=3062680 RepID=UPI0026E429AA|nr:sigma-70 family RNA polymerase sigma factor [Thalassotalea sp. 1_MG-2023]MDO6427335.1 sigma-70 family RNA polymerase sigma factor [Thalassotalea sp. 1_MG-2023]